MNDRKSIMGRLIFALIVFTAIFGFLIWKIYQIQFVDGDKYRQIAYNQYTTETKINAKRGTIYDRNMKEMAISVTAEDCIIVPNKIREMETDKRNTLENGLCELLGITHEELDVHISKKTNYRRVKEKTNIETANSVRKFIADNEFENYIYFEDNTKRYYPGNELASTVLGFTSYTETSGNDVVGITGIEKQYNNYLKGTPGRILTAQNGEQEEMPFKYESYIEAENGMNIVLTIDWTIQSYLEKHLETALVDNNARNKVCGIVMDVNTGEILAMSTKPDFNPNNHNEFTELALSFKDEYLVRPELKEEERNDGGYKSYLWKNKAVQELYEPGSTFKIATSAMALEEGVVKGTDMFECKGYEKVGGWTIKCHKTGGHGVETFEQGLQNSCNPVFMAVADRLKKDTFYNYFKSFGLTEKTGIDLPYERESIYHGANEFNETELAVYSFGQTFKVTPIRLITTLCSCANGGKLMKPYIVKKFVDDDGNTIESFSPQVVRQVSSEETSQEIMTYLYNGINVGSTSNAYVKGYKVAAKTGTSQKRDMEEGNYVASCISFAPADDPKIAVLILVDEPSGQYYGGTVAAPVARDVLADVLPYLNIEHSYTEEEKKLLEVSMKKYTGYNIEEARYRAEKDGFNVIVRGTGEVVNEQLPRVNSTIPAGGTVIFYTGDEVPAQDVSVPDVLGFGGVQATNVLTKAGLNISITGSYRESVSGAVAVKQTPEAGAMVQPGTTVVVEFKHNNSYD